MTHDRDIQELTRAIKANTRATEALHALMLDIERARRTEKAAAATECNCCKPNHDPISEN